MGKKKVTDWVKEHKVELIISGVGAVTMVVLILGMKKRIVIEECLEFGNQAKKIAKGSSVAIADEIIDAAPLSLVVPSSTVDKKYVPHEVRGHIRNLHEGWHASADKVASAATRGYELKQGQTWVEPYKTGVCVA